MGLQKFRIHAVLLVFILVVAAGLGLLKYREQNQIIEPLLGELQSISGIEKAEILPSSLKQVERRIINLTLDQTYPLAYTLGLVEQSLANLKGNFTVVLSEQPSMELWTLWEKIQVALEEALITGEFVLLEERIQNLLEDKEVHWELAIDQGHIYLRLSKGEFIIQRGIARQAAGKFLVTNQGGMIEHE